ncbi:MAG: hypothetical protein ABSF34_07815, partial [Verrucomicrobiota bacterium]
MLAWFIFVFATGLGMGEAFSVPAGLMLYRYPQNDLGAVYRPEATTLKLWAPTAKTVNVELFEDANTTAFSLTPMVSDSNGIWSVTLPGNLGGKYYLYQISLPGLKDGP